MTRSLILHERITTTVAKAKELRPFVEKLITLAKKNTLHARRLVIARMGPVGNPNMDWNESGDDLVKVDVIRKLFTEIGPRFKDRPGGYTRIIKLTKRRLGDAGPKAIIELLKEGETKVRAKKFEAPAPAPTLAPVAEQSSTAPETPASQAPAPQSPAPEAPAPSPEANASEQQNPPAGS